MMNKLDLLASLVQARIDATQAGIEKIDDSKEPDQGFRDALQHKLVENQITISQIQELQRRAHARENAEEVDEAKAEVIHAFFQYMGRTVPDTLHAEYGMATQALPVARQFIEERPEDAALLIVSLIDEYSANSVEPMLMRQEDPT